MADADQQDNDFISRALERRALTQAQASSLRYELKRRRLKEPGVAVHEVAIERGLLDPKTAQSLLGAAAAPARARPTGQPTWDATSEPTSLKPEDDAFNEVPRLVEPLPQIKPKGLRAGPRNPNEDSHLEMELPPPGSQSGDSLFEEGSTPALTPLPVTPQPKPLADITGSPIVVERTPSGFDESIGSTNLGLEPQTEGNGAGGDDWENNLSSADTLNGLTDEEDSAIELEPQTQSQPKMGTGPLPMFPHD